MTHARKTARTGYFILIEYIKTRRFDAVCRTEHIGATTGRSHNRILNRLEQAVPGILGLAELPKPARAGTQEYNGDAVAALLVIVGVSLLNRTTRRITLTEEGRH